MLAKAQHYVPQFYLRNFITDPSGKTSRIWCFDKVANKRFETNIKNVAHETGFNNYEDETGQFQTLEIALAEMEGSWQTALEILCNNPSRDTLESCKETVAHFLAFQSLRISKTRQVVEEMADDVASQFRRLGVKDARYTRNEIKRVHLTNLMKSAPQMAQFLLAKGWVLIKNISTTPYWTSDNPMFSLSQLTPTFFSDGTIGASEIYIALNPQLAIGICDDHRFANVGAMLLDDSSFLNRGQVICSDRYLFSSQGDFTLARSLISHRPELKRKYRGVIAANPVDFGDSPFRSLVD